jgi:hypothetical protein
MINPMRMRLAGHVARMGKRNAYRVLVGKSEGKRPLGRHIRNWEVGIAGFQGLVKRWDKCLIVQGDYVEK